MLIREIIKEAAAPLPPMPPLGGSGDPSMGAGAPMPPAGGAIAPASPPPPPPTGTDDDMDVSDTKYSQSKSEVPEAQLNYMKEIIFTLREKILRHHEDPQIPVSELLRKLNQASNGQYGEFKFRTIESAVDSGQLEELVDKVVTNTETGENMLTLKKDESEAPKTDNDGGSTSSKKPAKANTVSNMARHAMSK